MKEALLYKKRPGGAVECAVCCHRCIVKPGRRGACGTRENRGGRMYSLTYGKAATFGIDPVEKKPLFHFLPGSKTLSFAARGCNFACSFCQNNDISKENLNPEYDRDLAPEEIVSAAEKAGCPSISCTYTEPAVFFEYAMDTAVIAKKRNIKTVFVTNGYMTPEALKLISPVLDAANVDLKSFSDEFYRKFCGARLQPVLENIKAMKQAGIWLEATTLIIPGRNDSPDEMRSIAGFMAAAGRNIPWHVSRFFPAYKDLGVPHTPMRTLDKAVRTGRDAGLNHVYSGNAPGEGTEDTFCPACGKQLISREGCLMKKNLLKDGACPACGAGLEGVFA